MMQILSYIKHHPESVVLAPALLFVAAINWPFAIGLLACFIVVALLELVSAPGWLQAIILNATLFGSVAILLKLTGTSLSSF